MTCFFNFFICLMIMYAAMIAAKVSDIGNEYQTPLTPIIGGKMTRRGIKNSI